MDERFVKRIDVGVGDIHWWHSIYIPGHGYTEGKGNHGPNGGDWPHTRYGMPKDCTGMRVLDIGAWDGFFSFKAEELGAKFVLATDCDVKEGGTWAGSEGFKYAKKARGSNVDWTELNIEKDDSIYFSTAKFDLVMCYGVLYHLRNPLQAMYNLAQLTKQGGVCLIETAKTNENVVPMLEYRPGFDEDPTNYFYPNDKWLELVAKEVGFKSIEKIYNEDTRATYRLTK